MKRTNPSQLSAVLTALLLIGFAYSASSQSMLVLSNKWGIQAGTRSYLNTTNNWPRGIMINRTTGHVLIPTGTPVPQVNILRDGDDGREWHGRHRFWTGNAGGAQHSQRSPGSVHLGFARPEGH